jgi:hypothetical protein
VKKKLTVHYAKFALVPSCVNDDCADCGQIQNPRDDEHDVSDHARIGQEEQGSQEPKAIGPDAYSGRAVFFYQMANLGNVSCGNYTSSDKSQDLRQTHEYTPESMDSPARMSSPSDQPEFLYHGE